MKDGIKKISTETIYVKPLGRKWTKTISFDKKLGVFVIAMPREFASLFPKDLVRGKDLETLNSEFKGAISKWEEAAVRWRKVIIYRFSLNLVAANGKAVRQDFKSSFERHPDNAIGFEWETCRERTALDEVRYFRIREDDENRPQDWDDFKPGVQVPSADGHGRHQADNETLVLDWTADREAFFRSMEGSIRSLIMRAQDFETKIKDPVILDKLAASNTLLLPAPAKEVS